MKTAQQDEQKEQSMSKVQKFERVVSETLEWSEPEYEVEVPTKVVVTRGWEIEIEKRGEREWQWSVQATSEVSETPELLAMGTSRGEHAAEWASTGALNAELKRQWKQAKEAAEELPTLEELPQGVGAVPLTEEEQKATEAVAEELAEKAKETK